MSLAVPFRERVSLDEQRGEWRDGEARYLMIRHDSLMGLFRRLPAAARGDALAAFAESVAEHGRRSAESYRMSAAETDALLAAIAQTAGQLGWGRWRLERVAHDTLRLEVINSPFATGYGSAREPVCAAIVGMLRAVATLVFGAPAVAEEIICAATEQHCCRFVAGPRAEHSNHRSIRSPPAQ